MSHAVTETLTTTIRELVDANHILFDQGVVDGFGHVSARHPERPDRFLLARSMAPDRLSHDTIASIADRQVSHRSTFTPIAGMMRCAWGAVGVAFSCTALPAVLVTAA